MSVWLAVGRLSAGINLVLVAALGAVWLRNYRQHGASHTLGLLAFAAFLLAENALWLYFYVFHAGYVGWFVGSGADVQVGVSLLCGLETVALAFVARITWL